MTCNCKSYNRADWGGDVEEVVLEAPEWSKKKTICVDACIAETIQKLWSKGFITLNSCCGHGVRDNPPSIIVPEEYDWEKIMELSRYLRSIDNRIFTIYQWQLVDAERFDY